MKNKKNNNCFGKRLAELRRSQGLTQTELGKKIGVSKRVVAYYEVETKKIPADFLIPLSKALKVPADRLLGIEKVTLTDPEHAKIWRRLKKVELLPTKDKNILFNFLNALLHKNKLT